MVMAVETDFVSGGTLLNVAFHVGGADGIACFLLVDVCPCRMGGKKGWRRKDGEEGEEKEGRKTKYGEGEVRKQKNHTGDK